MDELTALSEAIDHVLLTHGDDFTTDEIIEASKYALRKYGYEYPPLGEAIVQIIQQQRFSSWTYEYCKQKRGAHA